MYLKILISDDHMEAVIEEALFQRESKKIFLLGLILSHIAGKHIVYGILKQDISKMVGDYIRDGISLQGKTVARGKYPISGKNSTHLYFDHRAPAFERYFENIEDHYRTYKTHFFLEGESIGEEGEPTNGEVGYNLYGEIVAPKPGNVVQYEIDSRTVILRNNRLIARISGIAIVDNGTVKIIPLMKLSRQNRVLEGVIFPLPDNRMITMEQVKGMVATLKLNKSVPKNLLYSYLDRFRDGEPSEITLLSLISNQENDQFMITPFSGNPELIIQKFHLFSAEQRRNVGNYIVTVDDQIMNISSIANEKTFDLFGKSIDIFQKEIPFEMGKNIEKKKGHLVSKTFGILYQKDTLIDVLPLLDIASDRMSVRVTLLNIISPKMPQSIKDLIVMLDLFEIKYGVSHEILQELFRELKEKAVSQKIVAKGTDPVYGRKARVISLIEFTKSAGILAEDGSIDFRERSFIQNVKAGDPVAKEIPEIVPVDRCDIYGRKIKAEWESKDTGLTIGQNIEQRSDKLYYATIQGIISVSGKRLSVFNIVQISQDINFDIGNISATGMVQVKGSLLPGFSIRAKGDVIIDGVVDNGIVASGGHIVVKKGITGSGKSDIQSEGDLAARFINNARVVVLGNLDVSDSIINSHVFCDGKITVLKIHGYIIGGEVYARNRISCKEIGSAMGRSTIVGIKFDLTADRILTRLNDQLKEISKEILGLQRLLGGDFIKNPREKLKKMDLITREQMQSKLSNLLVLIQKQGEINRERQNLIVQKSKDLDIKISADICYSGTVIRFNDQEYHIKNTITSVTFKLSDKGLIQPIFSTRSKQ